MRADGGAPLAPGGLPVGVRRFRGADSISRYCELILALARAQYANFFSPAAELAQRQRHCRRRRHCRHSPQLERIRPILHPICATHVGRRESSSRRQVDASGLACPLARRVLARSAGCWPASDTHSGAGVSGCGGCGGRVSSPAPPRGGRGEIDSKIGLDLDRLRLGGRNLHTSGPAAGARNAMLIWPPPRVRYGRAQAERQRQREREGRGASATFAARSSRRTQRAPPPPPPERPPLAPPASFQSAINLNPSLSGRWISGRAGRVLAAESWPARSDERTRRRA